jgi:hypothetical protein
MQEQICLGDLEHQQRRRAPLLFGFFFTLLI